ncbi:MAG: hypothetical protein JW850_03925 [Thermoflexales bacterium]|nr:hypothetical protein [Thermoflexales bacterium]
MDRQKVDTTNVDEVLQADRAIERALWKLTIANITPVGERALRLYEALRLESDLLFGCYRRGPNYDPRTVQADFLESLREAGAFLAEQGQPAEAAPAPDAGQDDGQAAGVYSREFITWIADTAEKALIDWLDANAPPFVHQALDHCFILHSYLEADPMCKDNAGVTAVAAGAIMALSGELLKLGWRFKSPIGEII